MKRGAPMSVLNHATPTRLRGTPLLANHTPSQCHDVSSLESRGNATRRGNGDACESRALTDIKPLNDEDGVNSVSTSHVSAARKRPEVASQNQKVERSRTPLLRPALVEQPSETHGKTKALVPHHLEELWGLHADQADEITANRLREGFSEAKHFPSGPLLTSRRQHSKDKRSITVDTEQFWNSTRMRTLNIPSELYEPSYRSLDAASRRGCARTSPDLFHVADTVQIAGGTFTSAGTVTNITYSFTVPSRSYLPSIPLSSWFSRVRLR